MLGLIWDQESAPVTDPVDALQRLAGRLQNAADVLGGRLEVGDLDGPTGLAWARVLHQLRLALDGMARLNLEERHVRIEQERAQIVIHAFNTAVHSLGLVPVDHAQVITRFLSLLQVQGGTPAVEALAAASERTFVEAGETVAGVVRSVLDRLDLTQEQWVVASRAVPEELRRLSSEDEPVVRGELA